MVDTKDKWMRVEFVMKLMKYCGDGFLKPRK
jgi:hypothetical protein